MLFWAFRPVPNHNRLSSSKKIFFISDDCIIESCQIYRRLHSDELWEGKYRQDSLFLQPLFSKGYHDPLPFCGAYSSKAGILPFQMIMNIVFLAQILCYCNRKESSRQIVSLWFLRLCAIPPIFGDYYAQIIWTRLEEATVTSMYSKHFKIEESSP